MHIAELCDDNRAEWDDYVHRAAGGLPQHLSGWREVLTRTYGFETRYLMAQRRDDVGDARIVGVMPLYLTHSLLLGRAAATMPGGLCAESDDIAQALIQRATSIAEDARASRVTLQDTRYIWPGDFSTDCQHVDWLLELRGDEEAVFNGLHRNIRRQVRMARRNGLVAQVDRSGALIDDFYSVLSRFTHQMGTPVFGRDFLYNIADQFPGGFNVVVVCHEDQPIGGYFQLELGDSMQGMWGATLHEYLKLRPVYLAYWEIIAHAVERGFRWLDMGRSPVDSNASHFKGQWADISRPVYQQVLGLDSEHVETSVVARVESDSRFRSFRHVWPKVPFPIAQFLGPKLRRHVPFA